jgi:hypothetical protein
MIKLNLPLKIATFALASLSYVIPFKPIQATTFEETQVDQSQFVAVVQPYGDNKYNLIVVEQIQGKQACWNESGANPVSVDLLLMNFDFSGHCRRSTDANGYSIRYNGQDLGLNYILSIVENNGELQLIGINRVDRTQPNLVVGTTKGIMGQPMRIELNPGWNFSKRTYEGKVLGHVYFSYSDGDIPTAETTPQNQTVSTPNTPQSNQPGLIEIVAPNTNPPETNLNKSQQVNDDSQSFLPQSEKNENLTPVSNHNSQTVLTTSTTSTESKPAKNSPNPLTTTRFERMKNN